MGFFAASRFAAEPKTPLGNRVVGSEAFSYDHARLPALQLPESHQEIVFTLTISVSGRWSFWTVDAWEGLHRDPTSLHKYLYANADPVSLSDPTGSWSLFDITLTQGIMQTLRSIEAGYTVCKTLHKVQLAATALFMFDLAYAAVDLAAWGWKPGYVFAMGGIGKPLARVIGLDAFELRIVGSDQDPAFQLAVSGTKGWKFQFSLSLNGGAGYSAGQNFPILPPQKACGVTVLQIQGTVRAGYPKGLVFGVVADLFGVSTISNEIISWIPGQKAKVLPSYKKTH